MILVFTYFSFILYSALFIGAGFAFAYFTITIYPVKLGGKELKDTFNPFILFELFIEKIIESFKRQTLFKSIYNIIFYGVEFTNEKSVINFALKNIYKAFIYLAETAFEFISGLITNLIELILPRVVWLVANLSSFLIIKYKK